MRGNGNVNERIRLLENELDSLKNGQHSQVELPFESGVGVVKGSRRNRSLETQLHVRYSQHPTTVFLKEQSIGRKGKHGYWHYVEKLQPMGKQFAVICGGKEVSRDVYAFLESRINPSLTHAEMAARFGLGEKSRGIVYKIVKRTAISIPYLLTMLQTQGCDLAIVDIEEKQNGGDQSVGAKTVDRTESASKVNRAIAAVGQSATQAKIELMDALTQFLRSPHITIHVTGLVNGSESSKNGSSHANN
jgi:uncharacterized UPF0146 family protein